MNLIKYRHLLPDKIIYDAVVVERYEPFYIPLQHKTVSSYTVYGVYSRESAQQFIDNKNSEHPRWKHKMFFTETNDLALQNQSNILAKDTYEGTYIHNRGYQCLK